MRPNKEIAGYISVKHVYEIARVKSADPMYDCVPLQKICEDVIIAANTMGIKTVHNLDDKWYSEFLEKRKEEVVEQIKKLEEKRQSKVLRTG